MGWLDAWTDLTTWWIEPTISAAESWRARPEQLLAQLVEGIGSRFGGLPFEMELRGHRLKADLDSLRLLPRQGGTYDVRIDASDAVVEGFRVDTIDAVLRSVRLEPGIKPKLVGASVEVSGSASLHSLVTWIDGRIPQWRLSLDGEGDGDDDEGSVEVGVIARRDGSDVSVLVEPWVLDDALHLEVRAVRWRRLRIRVPRWLRVERVIRLELGAGWRLTEANRSGQGVRFRLRSGAISHELQLPGIREAILHGTRLVP